MSNLTVRQQYKLQAPVSGVEFPDAQALAKYAGVEIPTTNEGFIQASCKALARFAGEYADAMLEEETGSD